MAPPPAEVWTRGAEGITPDAGAVQEVSAREGPPLQQGNAQETQPGCDPDAWAEGQRSPEAPVAGPSTEEGVVFVVAPELRGLPLGPNMGGPAEEAPAGLLPVIGTGPLFDQERALLAPGALPDATGMDYDITGLPDGPGAERPQDLDVLGF